MNIGNPYTKYITDLEHQIKVHNDASSELGTDRCTINLNILHVRDRVPDNDEEDTD